MYLCDYNEIANDNYYQLDNFIYIGCLKSKYGEDVRHDIKECKNWH
jgi:hypothetical protein